MSVCVGRELGQGWASGRPTLHTDAAGAPVLTRRRRSGGCGEQEGKEHSEAPQATDSPDSVTPARVATPFYTMLSRSRFHYKANIRT